MLALSLATSAANKCSLVYTEYTHWLWYQLCKNSLSVPLSSMHQSVHRALGSVKPLGLPQNRWKTRQDGGSISEWCPWVKANQDKLMKLATIKPCTTTRRDEQTQMLFLLLDIKIQPRIQLSKTYPSHKSSSWVRQERSHSTRLCLHGLVIACTAVIVPGDEGTRAQTPLWLHT